MIIITILLLGLIIFLHEFGHYFTAKMFNMPVSEFSIGMGPLIFKKVYKGTQYSLRLIPIGGYVLIEGMLEASKEDKEFANYSDEEIEEYNKKGFISHKNYEKLIVLLAGIIMNILTAFIAYLILAMIIKPENSYISFAINNFKMAFLNTINSLKLLITDSSNVKNLVGPVGLPSILKQAVSTHGYIVLISLFALLSINIAIFNLLPIPALDGGRIIFVILESFGIKTSKKIEEKIHTVGMILLLLLMAYVFINDILRIWS